jgi:O-antigen/teichoic acid export membrane protein
VTHLLGRRIVSVFATRAAVFALGLLTTYLLALVLGPSGRGSYYLAVLVPATLFTVGQLGIPPALTFYAGRGASLDGLLGIAAVLATLLSLACVVPALLARDLLVSTIVPGATLLGVTLAIASVPFLFASAFAVALLLGLQQIRTTNLLQLGQGLATFLVMLVVLGLLGWGSDGAVGAYLVVSVGAALAATLGAAALAPRRRLSGEPLAPLLGYALRVYPGSLASFFSYRADIFLISIILGDPAAVGLYALAVSLAEMVFYVADAVSTALFPQVSSVDRSEADRLAPRVSRASLLVTAPAALVLIPVSALAVRVTLPEFVESIAPFCVLLPGVVALSVSKVLSSYVSGIGHPGSVTRVAVTSLAVNVAANILLIPTLGIVGAALASTISYSVNACLMVVLASRLAGVTPGELVIPTLDDARRLLGAAGSMVADRVGRPR